MAVIFAAALAAATGLAIAAAAFRRPDRMFRRSALAALCAVILPYAIGFAVAPLLGDGAGMGLAFILYALSAVILLGALSASLGAAARHIWTALRG